MPGKQQLLPKSALLGIGLANMFMHHNGMKRKACAGFSKPSQKLREMATCPAWNSLDKADYIHFLADREKKRIHDSLCQVSAMTL